jgi:hypothetical protein
MTARLSHPGKLAAVAAYWRTHGHPDTAARIEGELAADGRCVRCGRLLTATASVERSIGPECLKKEETMTSPTPSPSAPVVREPQPPQPAGLADLVATFATLAGQIAKTEFVPKALRGRPEAVLSAMLYGRELGLEPMTSLRLIQVVDGNVGLSAEGMRAVVRAHGHRLWVAERTDDSVTVCGQRAGDPTVESVTWTMHDAEQAGLTKKDVWVKYPRAMLLARATSELCRGTFADVIGGLSYTPEELESIDASSWEPPAVVATSPAYRSAVTHSEDSALIDTTTRARLEQAIAGLTPDQAENLRGRWRDAHLPNIHSPQLSAEHAAAIEEWLLEISGPPCLSLSSEQQGGPDPKAEEPA